MTYLQEANFPSGEKITIYCILWFVDQIYRFFQNFHIGAIQKEGFSQKSIF